MQELKALIEESIQQDTSEATRNQNSQHISNNQVNEKNGLPRRQTIIELCNEEQIEKSADKGQGLQQTIAGVLKDEAKVIYKKNQETIEIRYIDDKTSKIDIQIALQKATGGACNTLAEAIRIRKAYRGTQIPLVALLAAIVHDLLKASSKIRIGWVNCRIKIIKKLIRCFKCWLFGHYRSQCKSEVNRTNLCIRCGQEGHKIANCTNAAKCALCAANGNSENVAHHAGTHRCPVYREAMEKIINVKA
ncbi:uncharacterized protein LOC113380563 [Ctenocephalides felis]|uniref:uncharacterized protein LOC113380563 n=1 Tax=Ctenocephalides felis TaxID=7515 RepID=UPI000E6E29B5|nr:uncharacterized protein LOC113380563 [Ctenocephalides felis]